MIDYALPKGADRIYKFLIRIAPPGTSIQFDKDDFDQHCIQSNRARTGKPYSKRWFKHCFDKLVGTGLVKVEIKFRGLGFQVKVYHPWHLDDWLIDQFKKKKTKDFTAPHPPYFDDAEANRKAGRQKKNKNTSSVEDDRQATKSDRGTKNPTNPNSDRQQKKSNINTGELKRNISTPPYFDDRQAVSSDRPIKNETFSSEKVKKTSKKVGCDIDSAVALDREKKVKGSKGNTEAQTSTKSVRPKPILKKTASAAAPQTTSTWKRDDGGDPKNNGSFSQGKGGEHIDCHKTESKGLEEDLNSNLDNVSELDGTEKTSGGVDSKVNTNKNKDTTVSDENKNTKSKPSIEVKINNKEWRSHLDELDQLNVTGNETIVNAVKTYSKEKVENAIALYRQRKRVDGYIENPCGYFMQALKEDWGSKKKLQDKEVLDESIDPTDKEAIFRHWFELAKTLGNCQLSEIREDGERWVLISGMWEKFTDVWERGYTIAYFKKILKRNKDMYPNS